MILEFYDGESKDESCSALKFMRYVSSGRWFLMIFLSVLSFLNTIAISRKHPINWVNQTCYHNISCQDNKALHKGMALFFCVEKIGICSHYYSIYLPKNMKVVLNTITKRNGIHHLYRYIFTFSFIYCYYWKIDSRSASLSLRS